MAKEGLRYQFARLSIAEKIIAINVIVFIVIGLLEALLALSISEWFVLPKDLKAFFGQPWSLVTYSFLHGGFWHILWNMYLLYVASKILLNLFDGRRFLNVYFLGVILGGLLFIMSYNIFPTLIKSNSVLLGASAGVMSVLIFVCAYIPNHEIRIIFFNVKLWQVGLFVVIMDLVQIPVGNIGGHIAHLGGALLGYVYARQLKEGRDIGSGFAKFLDGFANIFKAKEKKAPMKTVYKNKASAAKSRAKRDKDSHQRQIDSILDKISKSGYESLSKAEKDFLFKAGKED